MWILPLIAALVSAPPAISLPESIRITLNEEYPGWKLAPVNAQIQAEFKKHKINRSPSLAAGDFDHNGKLDYAVQIALTTPGQEEQIVIIFVNHDNAFEEHIVQSMGLDPTTYLWISLNKLLDRQVLRVLGGAIGDTAYAYEDGKFQEVQVEEDPEHPDPEIPRAPIPL